MGTGSVRACIIDSTGDMRALATENIVLWQPAVGYYVSIPILQCIEHCCAKISLNRSNQQQIFGDAFARV